MELNSKLKLVQVPILIIWLVTVLLPLVSCTSRLAGSATAEENVYDQDRSVLEDVAVIRSLWSPQDVPAADWKRSVDSSAEKHVQKRIPFGFSGLDNLDHILTTLERKPKQGSSIERGNKMDRDIYYLMKTNG